MARKLELSYHKARRQWRKKRKIDGKDRYFYLGESGVNKTDAAAYQTALADWRQIEDRLASEKTEEEREAVRGKHPALYAQAQAARAAVAERGREAQGEAFLANVAVIQSGLDGHPDFVVPMPGTDGADVDHAAARFLREFRDDVKLGTKSRSRHEALRVHLNRFTNWKPQGSTRLGSLAMASINETALTDYRSSLIDAITAGDIAHITARDAMMAARQFVRWAWEAGRLERLPRNTDSRKLLISVPPKKPRHLPVEQLRALVAGASDRTRLYMLLGLNTGATQIDIADLTPRELDLQAGTITRRRSKTGHHEGVPTVTYPLWPSTLALLRKHRAKKGDRVLLNEQGEALIREELRPDGSLRRVDNVRTAYRRLVTKLDNAAQRTAKANGTDAPATIAPHFKLLRATAANLLEQHPTFKAVTGLYLAHAPGSVRERYYTAADERLLAEAVTWLGETLGVAGEGTERADWKKTRTDTTR